MHRSRRSVLFALVLLALIGSHVAGLAYSVEDGSVPPNGSVVVRLGVRDAVDLGGTDLVLAYDPAVLRFESATTTGLADRATVSATGLGPGRLAVAVASPRSLSGTGPVVALTFAAVGPTGSRSPVTVESVRAVTVDGEVVPAQGINGTVSVGSGPGTPLSPFATAGALAVAAAWGRRAARKQVR